MKKYLVLFFGLFLIFISMSNVFSFAGGSGTQEDPYQISTWEELQNISSNPDSSYVLLNDLNSSTDGYGVYASKDANAGKGWIPLGNDSNKFNGTFNGQNHTIADLFINRPNTDYVGLFGYASENTNFSNINVKDFNITGYQNVGGLIGRGEGDVYNCFSKGNITGESYSTGGLIGYTSGTVKNSFSKANVTGNNRVGGLIGYSDENTYDSFSIGIVSGSSSVGGLIGHSGGNVENCFWDVETSGKASSDGGTGVSTAEMKDRIIYEFGGWNISPSNNDLNNGYPYLGWQANNNSFTWFIQENDTLFAGGNGSLENPYQIKNFEQLTNIHFELDANYTLVSDLNKSTPDYNSYASPNASIGRGFDPIGDSSYIFTGSFKGQNHTIADLFINRPNTDYVGLFGNVGNNVNISNLNLVNISITGNQYIGGLIGNNNGNIENCSVKGNITGSGGEVGGLIGRDNGNVNNCFSKGKIFGKSSSANNIGGLIGSKESGYLYDSSSEARVIGEDRGTGGLVGYNYGNIESCFSTGNVTGIDYGKGGFIGINYGHINNSFSTGNVTGSAQVGGFAGGAYNGNIENCFSTGTVSGDNDVGGFQGYEDYDASTNNCFWDVETSGKASSDGGIGMSSLEMKTRIIFNEARWNISPSNNDLNNGYPYLGWQANNNSFTWFIQENDTLFAGGNGSLENPYQIKNFEQLTNIHFELDANYTLVSDLNKSTPDYNSYASPNASIGRGFDPIGDSSYIFTGSFKGQNHTIADLFINRPNTDYVGLFGNVGNNVNISNLNLVNISITGNQYIGGLIGNNNGNIENCSVKGNITGSGGEVGGLIGRDNGNVNNCFSKGKIFGKSSSANRVGGLIGSKESGYLYDSYSEARVIGEDRGTGGLVGYNYGNIESCFSTGNVTGIDYGKGGFIGINYGNINNSFSTGNVTGSAQVGGFAGGAYNGNIENCFSTGTVSGDNDVGGFQGYEDYDASTNNCFWDVETSGKASSDGGIGMSSLEMKTRIIFNEARWNISPSNNDLNNGYPYLGWQENNNLFAGGNGSLENPYQIKNFEQLTNIHFELDANYTLVSDLNKSTPDYNSYASPNASIGRGFDPIGDSSYIFTGSFKGQNHTIADLFINRPNTDYVGLFGNVGNNVNISNLNLVNISITGNQYIGGLIGNNNGNIENCSVKGNITGSGGEVGGLIGRDNGNVNNCFSKGKIFGKSSSANRVGGLIGSKESGYLYDSYSEARVIGEDRGTGGLVGYNYGNIESCFSTGNVTGIDYGKGGFIGINYGNINNSFSTGNVTGSAQVGGFAGGAYNGNIENCFSTGTVSGDNDVGGFQGYEDYDASTNNCFWDVETSGKASSDGGIGMSSLEMKTRIIFNEARWNISPSNNDLNNGYPYLGWQENNNLFAGGNGSLENPYQIKNFEQLTNIHFELDANYTLVSDLNKSTPDYNSYASPNASIGRGFDPIGDSSYIFTGSFKGQNHTIADLFINRPNTDYVGLFGNVGNNVNISNLNLVNISITGNQYIGGLIGNNNGNIENCSVKGNITGSGGEVGGLIGRDNGNVNNCFSKGKIFGKSSSANRVGGLIGSKESGYLYDSYSEARVIGEDRGTGGLVGYNYGNIESCFSTGNVTGIDYGKGGFIGINYGNINNSFSTGNVTGSAQVGGFAGGAYNGNIENCFSTGTVSGDNDVGGFQGYEDYDASTNNCFWDVETSGKASSDGGIGMSSLEMKTRIIFNEARWNISPSNNDLNNGYPYLGWQENNNLFAGGNGSLENPYQIKNFEQLTNIHFELDANYTLVSDLNKSTPDYNSYASPNASIGRGFDPIGDSSYIFTGSFKGQNHTIADLFINRPNTDYVGLFGNVGNNVNISNLNLVNISITGNQYIGGLIGNNNGNIENCSVKGNITGSGGEVGGLIGRDNGNVNNCFSKGKIFGKSSSANRVGGLIGSKESGYLYDSYSEARVIGEDRGTGGLVGYNYGNIESCFSIGNVTGNDYRAGGFIGTNNGNINNSFSTGNVTGLAQVGGFAGGAYNGNIENCFSTGNVSGDNDVGGFQ